MGTLETVAAGAHERMAGENFPVALRVLPSTVRDQLERVYRYARFIDEVGDGDLAGASAPTADERLALLDLVAEQLHLLTDGEPQLRPVVDLRPLIRRGVPIEPFLDLVEANRLDQRVSSYRTFDDLLGYCRYSAAPVGRIVLHVAGKATDERIAWSDEVCAALQVLEHCQDVGEDARAGRVYLPADELLRAGIGSESGATRGMSGVTNRLGAHRTSEPLRNVVAVQVERSRRLLRAGTPLVRSLSGWSRLAVAGYVAGGLATADALERARYDVLALDVRPSKPRTIGHALTRWSGLR